MRYLTIYCSPWSEEFGTYDSETKRWRNLHRAVKDPEGDFAYGMAPRALIYGYWHPNESISEGKRNREGELLLNQTPRSIDPDSLYQYFLNLGKKKKRVMAQTSLDNLKKGVLNDANRYTPPQIIMESHVKDALTLRGEGHSWGSIGKRLNLNSSSIRVAVRRSIQKSNSLEASSLQKGAIYPS